MDWFSKDKKTQAELDAAFLAAVGAHDLAAVKKTLAQGANPHTHDSDGNGAFHALVVRSYYETPARVRDLIALLTENDVSPNARNSKGETCLHRFFERPHVDRIFARNAAAYFFWGFHTACSGALMLDRLLDVGADCDVIDKQGRTPLHAACLLGDPELVSMCIGGRESRLDVRDKDGFYPHDYALRAQIKDPIAFAVNITKRFDAFTEKQKPAPVAPVRDDSGWTKISETEIARVKTVDAIGYRLTEVFNFTDRLYMRVTHNIDTKAESAETRSFDDFSDKKLFVDAREELLRRGGAVDESVVYRHRLNKPSS